MPRKTPGRREGQGGASYTTDRRGKGAGRGRREVDRPPGPRGMGKKFNEADRVLRDLEKKISFLWGRVGIREGEKMTETQIVRLLKQCREDPKREDKVGNLYILRILHRRRREAAAQDKFWREMVVLGLVKDPKFVSIDNARAFKEAMFGFIREQEAKRGAISLVSIDLDLFKRINDKFGHQAGDVVIGELSKRLTKFAQAYGGFAARVGGEEFQMVLPIMPNELSAALTRLQRSFEKQLQHPEKFGITPKESWDGWKAPTFSAGICNRVGSERKKELGKLVSALTTQSDNALYQAKEAGRNRIGIHRLKGKI